MKNAIVRYKNNFSLKNIDISRKKFTKISHLWLVFPSSRDCQGRYEVRDGKEASEKRQTKFSQSVFGATGIQQIRIDNAPFLPG